MPRLTASTVQTLRTATSASAPRRLPSATPHTLRRTLFSSPSFPSRPFAPSSASAKLWNTNSAAWTGALLGLGAAAYLLVELKPELLPEFSTAHADSSSIYLDPTTKTPFERTLPSPDGSLSDPLVLVGTGVRTVSFLSIKVYAVGFYMSKSVLDKVKKGEVEGFQGYTAAQLLPPFPTGLPSDGEPLRGEALISKIQETTQSDMAVIIVPLRNTTLTHMRDAFARSLMARIKLPHVAPLLDEPSTEAAVEAITNLKTFFPGRTQPKGSPLYLLYSGASKTIRFEVDGKPPGTPTKEVLGTLKVPLLSDQLILAYFSDTGVISEELRASVARGLAGEER